MSRGPGWRERRKRRGKAKEARLQQRSADLSWSNPAFEEIDQFELAADVTSDLRIVSRLDEHRGRVIEFALTLLVWHDNRWVTVMRIDSCDGDVHRHQFYRDSNDEDRHHEELLTTPDRLTKLYESHYEALTDPDRVKEYERRWRDGR